MYEIKYEFAFLVFQMQTLYVLYWHLVNSVHEFAFIGIYRITCNIMYWRLLGVAF